MRTILLVIILLFSVQQVGFANRSPRNAQVNDTTIKFTCSTSETSLVNLGAVQVSRGTSTIYIGTNQVSSNNQNPIVTKFTNGTRDWCREDYETTGADGRGYGLLWVDDGLYGVFSTDGTQGSSSQDFRRFTSGGWLTSYGPGGGKKVAIILQLDPATGEGLNGTFLRAQLSSGNTNSFVVSNLIWVDGQLMVQAKSWYHPLNANGSRMEALVACAPQTDSPFDYTVTLAADLTQAVSAVCELVEVTPTPTSTTETPTPTPVTPTATTETPSPTPVTPTATTETPNPTPVTPTATTETPSPSPTPVTPTATTETPSPTPVTPTATTETPSPTPVTPTATTETPNSPPVTPDPTTETPSPTPVTPQIGTPITPDPTTETPSPTPVTPQIGTPITPDPITATPVPPTATTETATPQAEHFVFLPVVMAD